MNGNLLPSPNGHMIETPMFLQAAEYSFDSYPLVIEGFKFEGLPCEGLFMARWCFDDGLGSVLSADMPSKVFAGVALIGHHEVGMELGGCVSGLHQHTGCPTDVMDVGRGDYHCEGEFVFAVNGQMSLVAQPELLQVARSIFYGPGACPINPLPAELAKQ